LQELGNYITYIFAGHEELMEKLVREVIELMKSSYRDERVMVPLLKTVDFILEREEVMGWRGMSGYDEELFGVIRKEIGKGRKNILKVCAVTGVYVSLLSLNNGKIKKMLLESIISILCSDLPKARKLLADKLLLLIMSQEE
jgi:hypothetical protein